MVLSLATLLCAATASAPLALPRALPLAPPPSVQQVPSDAERSLLAMTKDGFRLQVTAAPAVRATRVETDFGSYFTPLDPVAVVLKLPKRDLWRHELAADPTISLLPVIGAANGDGRIADLVELASTLEILWDQASDWKLKLQRRKEMVAASDALWKWGQRLDPVSGKLDRDERVEFLWKRMLKADGPSAILSGGRLIEEVAQAQGGIGHRQVRMVDLSRALSHKNPYVAHSAARISGYQHVMDLQHGSNILYASINHAHPVARDGFARAITKLYPDHARIYSDYLFGGKDDERITAAWHLVDHMPKQADGPMVAALSSTLTTTSRKITVGGLSIRVEDRRPRIAMPLRPNSLIVSGSATTSGGMP